MLTFKWKKCESVTKFCHTSNFAMFKYHHCQESSIFLHLKEIYRLPILTMLHCWQICRAFLFGLHSVTPFPAAPSLQQPASVFAGVAWNHPGSAELTSSSHLQHLHPEVMSSTPPFLSKRYRSPELAESQVPHGLCTGRLSVGFVNKQAAVCQHNSNPFS